MEKPGDVEIFKLPLEREPSVLSEMMRDITPERKQSMCKELLNRSYCEEDEGTTSRAKSDIDEAQLAEMIAAGEHLHPKLTDLPSPDKPSCAPSVPLSPSPKENLPDDNKSSSQNKSES